MAGKVVVHDVNKLEAYGRELSTLKGQIDDTAARLLTLSGELKTSAVTLGRATQAQGSNWSDPQYIKLKDEITPCVSAVTGTADSVQDTAAVVKATMAEVDKSIAYIRQLVAKLRNM